MKKLLSVFLAAVMLFTCVQSVLAFAADAGTTYYIDAASGSDTNSGKSENSAFASVAAIAGLSLKPGDSVLFKKGETYTGDFDITANGTADAHITFSSYGEGDNPILYTPDAIIIVEIIDSSYIDFKGFTLTAPQGQGLWLRSVNASTYNVTVSDCLFTGISAGAANTYLHASHSALRISNDAFGKLFNIHDCTIDNCEFANCCYGITNGGPQYTTDTELRNKNITVSNCSLHDIFDDAIIVMSVDYFTVTNCSIIDTCQTIITSPHNYYTAPCWTGHVDHFLYQYCEVSGSANYLDGMTIDFDGMSSNCLAQYIYSHDNARFVWNCAYDETNVNNCVRYCLSVNDNLSDNGEYSYQQKYLEHDFKFYNNTLYNTQGYNFRYYDDPLVCNNIFYFTFGSYIDYDYTGSRTYGRMSNNLYYNMPQPKCDTSGTSLYFVDPNFAGTDVTDKNSFILKSCSDCIGAGIQAEEDMGEHDFYGNALTAGMKHNIGCYEGPGVSGSKTSTSVIYKTTFMIRYVINWLNYQFNRYLKKLVALIATK